MPTNLTINGTTYSLPSQGDSPAWGVQISDIITALADGLTATIGPNDILPSTFTVGNNVITPTPISQLVFDQAEVRSAQITYSIDRSTSATELSENGILQVNYNNTTNTWNSSQGPINGDAQILFSIVSGQVFYTSSNLSGSNYSGKLGFSARAFGQ